MGGDGGRNCRGGERWSVMNDWRKRAVEVVEAEMGGGAEFILHRVLQSVAQVTPNWAGTPAHVLILLGMWVS